MDKETEEGLLKAVEYFDAAIAVEPGHAAAYAKVRRGLHRPCQLVHASA